MPHRRASSPTRSICMEWIGVCTMGFPEPFTFGLRACRFLRRRLADYDVLHDNQSLSYGIWALSRRAPTVATIHHPVTIDRRCGRARRNQLLEKAPAAALVLLHRHAEARGDARCAPIITVSECRPQGHSPASSASRPADLRVVPNGIDTDLFRPLPGHRPGARPRSSSPTAPTCRSRASRTCSHAVAEILRSPATTSGWW
ncbi:MAG: glycosyltransferase [Desulfobacterales bacterium]|nr:glycosyltransferase [Desulfobacterales bacterium]